MKRPDTPFPRHWLYYVILKYAVLAAAVVVTFYTVYRLYQVERNHTMPQSGPSFLGLRTHHLVIALVAVLIAVALASNYYLW
jgi:heme/copper-type cytochrome/quinol oxidase subunit 2